MPLEKYRRVLVTGGAGFIGCHLCEEVLNLGKEVVVVDDLSTGKRENILAGAKFIKLDIADRAGVRAALENIDLVFHLAAQPSASASTKEPDRDFESNARGTYNMLQAALQAKVKRFVYTSSAAVYGEAKRLPMDEEQPTEPGVPYGASKLSGERYTLVFNRAYGLSSVCLRPFNVYGPKENRESTLDEVFLFTWRRWKTGL